MATHVSVAPGGSPEDGWSVMIVGDAAGTVARTGPAVKVRSWEEFREIADQYGVLGREINGDGLPEMISALGAAPPR